MENASKALLMAAGVLIGVLVLALIIYLFTYFGAEAQKFSEIINQNQLTKYNAQYTVYDGRKDLSVYDVVSIINTAYENNQKHKDDPTYEDEYKVKVLLKGSDMAAADISNLSDKITALIEENYETEYKCNVSFYNDNGKVKEVKITKNN